MLLLKVTNLSPELVFTWGLEEVLRRTAQLENCTAETRPLVVVDRGAAPLWWLS